MDKREIQLSGFLLSQRYESSGFRVPEKLLFRDGIISNMFSTI